MKKISITAFLILLTSVVSSSVRFKDNELVYEDKAVIHKLSFKNGKVIPTSFYFKEAGLETLDLSQDWAWFEFVVDQQLLRATDPIWNYQSHKIRPLVNGGTELTINLEAKSRIKGLQIQITRQFFPGSTLLRERLVISKNSGNFSLNKHNGRLHFIFPRYAIKANKVRTQVEEIRIATFADELLDSVNQSLTYDDRKFDNAQDLNLANCHMFHPKIIKRSVTSGETHLFKGPFSILSAGKFAWMSTYEHASQDENYEVINANISKVNQAATAIDQQQGVEGQSGLAVGKDDFWFLGLEVITTSQAFVISVKQLRGGYLEGELFGKHKPYQTVWTTSTPMLKSENASEIIHHYLTNQITEHPHSRKSHFYYNTWGMQRDNNNKVGLREIFREDRILEEIKYAAELKVDLFVLDDGWEQTMGVWKPHKERLPRGLKPLIDEMRKYNIIPGIWLSPMGIDSVSQRYKDHQDWVIRDQHGKPIKAQWDFPAFDFVSGFYDLFLQDCKWLVDQGIRFFKFDAINTFNSSLPGLHHGTSEYTKEEIRDRYAYMLPFYVVNVMQELRKYNEEVVVEIDLTEKERCIVGLMPLQEGKFFWMNNGASGYNDFSAYRTKSMRTVLNRYTGIIPTELFTQAVYPHNEHPFFAGRYNVNTTLVGGRGFWGNLKMMKPEQRQRAGELVTKSKMVLPYIQHLPLEVQGVIGSTPELYVHLNRQIAAGQVIGFSGTATNYPVNINLNSDNCLGALNHAYQLGKDKVTFTFQFNRPDDTKEAFILPNHGSGISIVSANTWIDALDLNLDAKKLKVSTKGPAVLICRFPKTFTHLQDNRGILPLQQDQTQENFNFYRIDLPEGGTQEITWK